ncbi:putative transmembrane protein 109-like [Scophthalmus maximus]|uniref:Putative transmembrane protein 109-like n=1 Tax=Scophthalmus maximus TaxID=52904 RepID=A0A2U9C8Q6_SCOMX|nr:putative transmembrane protein 109-like [Scophthalmus maximus]
MHQPVPPCTRTPLCTDISPRIVNILQSNLIDASLDPITNFVPPQLPHPSPLAHIPLLFLPIHSSSSVSCLHAAAQRALSCLESFLGQEKVHSVAMFFGMVIRFLAEGAASGLNVIAVYVTEILRVTGFDVAKTLPRFTPEGVTSFAQWGLLALIGYWVLIVVLRLLFAVFRQVFWVVKTVLALWLFGLIVTDRTAAADITAVRLVGLVLVCALLTLLSSASEKSCAVEHRLSCLEGRLKAVEKRKGD